MSCRCQRGSSPGYLSRGCSIWATLFPSPLPSSSCSCLCFPSGLSRSWATSRAHSWGCCSNPAPPQTSMRRTLHPHHARTLPAAVEPEPPLLLRRGGARQPQRAVGRSSRCVVASGVFRFIDATRKGLGVCVALPRGVVALRCMWNRAGFGASTLHGLLFVTSLCLHPGTLQPNEAHARSAGTRF